MRNRHYIFIAMLVGATISYLLGSKVIAIASAAAFFVGEGFDWAIFTFTRKPLSQRLVISSVVSSPVDTVVFLGVAGRLHVVEFFVMTFGKLVGIFLLWFIWKYYLQRKNMLIAI